MKRGEYCLDFIDWSPLSKTDLSDSENQRLKPMFYFRYVTMFVDWAEVDDLIVIMRAELCLGGRGNNNNKLHDNQSPTSSDASEVTRSSCDIL